MGITHLLRSLLSVELADLRERGALGLLWALAGEGLRGTLTASTSARVAVVGSGSGGVVRSVVAWGVMLAEGGVQWLATRLRALLTTVAVALWGSRGLGASEQPAGEDVGWEVVLTGGPGALVAWQLGRSVVGVRCVVWSWSWSVMVMVLARLGA